MLTVGPGMQARMGAHQDHPIYGHEQGQNQDGSSFEKCWGTRGLYISSNASGQWENVGPFWGTGQPPQEEPASAPILTVQGVDIRALVVASARTATIPPELLLGCLMAESELDARAERYGVNALTARVKAAIAANDRITLQQLLPQAGNDISFGLGQRVVIFHYFGNRQNTVDNVLAVRAHVFANTDEDVLEAAKFLTSTLQQARAGNLSSVQGDELLGACVAYNAGHYPTPTESYWQERASTVARYRDKLAIARTRF